MFISSFLIKSGIFKKVDDVTLNGKIGSLVSPRNKTKYWLTLIIRNVNNLSD